MMKERRRKKTGGNMIQCTLHFEGTKPYVLCTKCTVILWDEFAAVVLTE